MAMATCLALIDVLRPTSFFLSLGLGLMDKIESNSPFSELNAHSYRPNRCSSRMDRPIIDEEKENERTKGKMKER